MILDTLLHACGGGAYLVKNKPAPTGKYYVLRCFLDRGELYG